MWYIRWLVLSSILFTCLYAQDELLVKPSIQEQLAFSRELSRERIDDEHIKPIVEPYIFSYIVDECNNTDNKDIKLLYSIIHNEPVAHNMYECTVKTIIYQAMKNALLPYCVKKEPRRSKRDMVISAGVSSFVTALITSSVSLITYFLTNQDCSK